MGHAVPWLLSESNSDVQNQPSGTAKLSMGQDDPGGLSKGLSILTP